MIKKKRLKREERLFLARQVIDHSLALIAKDGEFVEIKNIDTRPKGLTTGNFHLMLTTPFNKIKDINYILDIWHEGKGKVFSVHWDKPSNLDIVNFKKGDWLVEFLSRSLNVSRK